MDHALRRSPAGDGRSAYQNRSFTMPDCQHHFVQVVPLILKEIDHAYKPAHGPKQTVPVMCSKWKCKKCRKIEWFPLCATMYKTYGKGNRIERIKGDKR